ncbi:MAG: DNA-formamidopyrimidine glycosylase family protein [Bryobacteraceae bacterium]
MPELPDIEVYIEAIGACALGAKLEAARVASPFLVRTIDPPLTGVEGATLRELRRVGKRIAFGFDNDLWLVLHLMIAGRLHWSTKRPTLSARRNLASFDFAPGSLSLTEAGTQRRASVHMVRGEAGLRSLDPGGLEVLTATEAQFAEALQTENHTLKRALTDPRSLSGIGNAYSDEILHRARLSPVALTQKLPPEAVARLFAATREVLLEWIERLRRDANGEFPEKVTAFRPEMAAHGRFGQPCPRCGEKIQRIRYADNETNYCAACQTGGKLLADRGLSRLMKSDWPKTLVELETLVRKRTSKE